MTDTFAIALGFAEQFGVRCRPKYNSEESGQSPHYEWWIEELGPKYYVNVAIMDGTIQLGAWSRDKRVVESYELSDPNVTTKVAERLELLIKVLRIKKGVDLNNEDRHILDEEYRQKKQDLNDQLRKLRDSCPHLETDYHPDPSGNNDTCHSCTTCGKEAHRLSGLGGIHAK